VAQTLDAPELLRYRSNLLGSDLRITNFGGGNTSSKIQEADPLDGSSRTVLWIKAAVAILEAFSEVDLQRCIWKNCMHLSGGIAASSMKTRWSGCTRSVRSEQFGCGVDRHAIAWLSAVAHIDHLHPDWGIALAAAANGAREGCASSTNASA